MNVSQEGKAFVDDLREKYLNCTKVNDGRWATCKFLSMQSIGLSLVEQMPEKLKNQVSLVYPTGIEGGPRQIRFDRRRYFSYDYRFSKAKFQSVKIFHMSVVPFLPKCPGK